MTGAWVTTVQKTVQVSQLLFSDKALTMSARSFGWGKMQSRTVLDRSLSWEYCDDLGFVRVVFGALYAYCLCSWAFVQNS